MQIVQSPINNFIYLIFSLLFSALITGFLIRKLKFKDYEIKTTNIKYSAIISLFVVSITFIMSPLILIFINKYIVNQLKISSNSGVGVIIYIIIAVLEITPAIIVVKLRKESLFSLGITKLNIFKSIFIGSISYFIYLIFIIIMQHRLKYIFHINSVFSTWNFLNCIFTALGEEILFRGYLQNRLIKWLGDKKGLIITALVFSFFHIFQRILTGMSFTNAIISVIAILPVALFYGYLFLKCKNVIASTIFHTFFDFFLNNL